MTQNHEETASKMTTAYKGGYFYSEEVSGEWTDKFSGTLDKIVFQTANPDLFQIVPAKRHIVSITLGDSKWILMKKPHPFTVRAKNMKSIQAKIQLDTDYGKIWLFRDKQEYEKFMGEINTPTIF